MMLSLRRTIARTLGFNPLAWVRDTWRMRRMARAFDAGAVAPVASSRCLVVISPWDGSGVPWLSLAMGLLLSSSRSRVTFVIDDLPFGDKAFRFRFVLACLRFALAPLRGRYEVIDLSDGQTLAEPDQDAREMIDHLARLNAVWALRGETLAEGRAEFIEICSRNLTRAYGPIASLLQPDRFDLLFTPGGVYANSGLWAARARQIGLRIGSYDNGGYGSTMLTADGIACQLQDIPRAFGMMNADAARDDERAFIIDSAEAEIARRRAGTDTFSSQIKGATIRDPRFDGAVLIALNSSWDASALGLHAVFDDSTEWLVETVRHLLEHTKTAVVVRQHPAERLEFARTTDDYAHLLKSNFGDHPRLRFVAAAEPVNSYDLLDQVSAVVVYTSTIGVEAAIRGLPVVTESNSYYADLGFVWKAADRETYRTLLTDMAAGALSVTPRMSDAARLCYYLTQCRNFMFTPLNPAGFAQWTAVGLDNLRQDDKVKIMLRCLEDNVPMPYLNHRAAWDHSPESGRVPAAAG